MSEQLMVLGKVLMARGHDPVQCGPRGGLVYKGACLS